MTSAAAANAFEYQDGAGPKITKLGASEAPAHRHGGGSGHKQDMVAD
jgi:hypothetical protein